MNRLKRIDPDDLEIERRDPLDRDALRIAEAIVRDVRARGEDALREYAEKFGEVEPAGKLFYTKGELNDALSSIDEEDRRLLERTASRIARFATAQRESVRSFETEIPGGIVGQEIVPVASAGCYAPGGRFPLPSSVLMTAIAAKVAGVGEIAVASPNPTPITLAAAAVAGADVFVAAGGAQAIAALAYGAGPISACDMICGPGNKYVTAAKHLVSRSARIDMLAGPSELVVVACGKANAELIAADLLGQAEHDEDAVPILVTTDESMIDEVNCEIERQLAALETRETASRALENGFAIPVNGIDDAIEVCDRIAPEHLELQLEDAESVAGRFKNYGALFVGDSSAEVLGDYGAGPNHTLPTGGASRYTGGLSVMNFLRIRTWIRVDDRNAADGLICDAARFGEIEGLKGHAKSATLRLTKPEGI